VLIGLVCSSQAALVQLTDVWALARRPRVALRSLLDPDDLARLGSALRTRTTNLFDGIFDPAPLPPKAAAGAPRAGAPAAAAEAAAASTPTAAAEATAPAAPAPAGEPAAGAREAAAPGEVAAAGDPATTAPAASPRPASSRIDA
jgi:hypothetical protein